MGASMRGVIELNVLFTGTGLFLLWGLRGFRTWVELVESIGLALVLGAAAVGVLATLVLIAGTGLATWTIIGLCAAVAATGALVGRLRRNPLPSGLGTLPPFSAASAVSCVAAIVGALALVAVLVAFFRVARVTPLGGGDSYQFWVPKAKVIYFGGTIGGGFFGSLPSPRYPLYVPALQAMDFRFMGSANAPALAVQYWFLYAGFAFASVSILRRMVPAWLAWLFVALTGVIPELDNRLLGAQADWPLDLQFAIAVLLAAAWVRLRETWMLVALGIMLAALIATKQEGLLLAGSLYAGLALATLLDWRRAWPRLLAAGLAAYAVNLPWRIWWGTRSYPAQSGGFKYIHSARLGPSIHLAVRILFSYPMWLLFVPLALTAAATALTVSGKARTSSILFIGTAVTAFVGFTYVLWSLEPPILDERQSSTPIPRASGSIVLLATVMAPLLIAPLLRLRRPPPSASGASEAERGAGPEPA
ncbi:MAG TPA: hypothetical protein VGM80_04545 [Gaiellaceae bacterium]